MVYTTEQWKEMEQIADDCGHGNKWCWHNDPATRIQEACMWYEKCRRGSLQMAMIKKAKDLIHKRDIIKEILK